MSLHKITIKNMNKENGIETDKALSGHRTKVYLDDKPLSGVYKVDFSVEARDVAKVTIHMYVNDFILDDVCETSIIKKEKEE